VKAFARSNVRILCDARIRFAYAGYRIGAIRGRKGVVGMHPLKKRLRGKRELPNNLNTIDAPSRLRFPIFVNLA
jgi:hypothetical protein